VARYVSFQGMHIVSQELLLAEVNQLMLQAFGRTPLISISPKKTWEGAFAGLVGCISITILLSKSLSWPQSLVRYSNPIEFLESIMSLF